MRSTVSAWANSLVKGPFTAIYPGGLYAGTSFYDKASTVYYPFNLDERQGRSSPRLA